MTVSDLIQKLQHCAPGAEVFSDEGDQLAPICGVQTIVRPDDSLVVTLMTMAPAKIRA